MTTRTQEVRTDPNAMATTGQHLAASSLRFSSGESGAALPQVLGAGSIFVRLVVVVGPVDGVDKPHWCRWWVRDPMDDVWTTVWTTRASLWTHRRRPQGGPREAVVTPRRRGGVHVLSTSSSPGWVGSA